MGNAHLEASLLCELAAMYGENLKDGPSKHKTLGHALHRVTSTYLGHMSSPEAGPTLQRAFIKMWEHNIKPAYGADLHKLDQFVLNKLERVVHGGGDKEAQRQATGCLYALIKHAWTQNDEELFNFLYDRVIPVSLLTLRCRHLPVRTPSTWLPTSFRMVELSRQPDSSQN